jgi:hypothetical protein
VQQSQATRACVTAADLRFVGVEDEVEVENLQEHFQAVFLMEMSRACGGARCLRVPLHLLGVLWSLYVHGLVAGERDRNT